MKKKVLVVLSLILVFSFLAVACSSGKNENAAVDEKDTTKETEEVASSEKTESAEPEEKKDSLVVGYSPATLNNAFWLAAKDGVLAAIEEKGIEVKLVDIDANGDQSLMNDRISDLISSGIDALIFAPADSTAATAALEQCKDADVPVINFDTRVDKTDLVKTVIASDNYNAGYVVGADASEKMPDGAKILVLHSPRASACVERYDGFVKALDESGKSYDIINVLDGEGDQETSLALASDAIVADPDLSVIFAVNDPSAMGAVNAVQQSSVEVNPDLMIYGVDGNPDAKTMIKDGVLEGTGAQSPETMGYKSMMAAFDYLEGKELEPEVVVDTFLIDINNVDEYGTDKWQ